MKVFERAFMTLVFGMASTAFSGLARAETTLILSPTQASGIAALTQVCSHSGVLSCEPVFSPSEKAAILKMGQTELGNSKLAKVKSAQDIQFLKAWVAKRKLKVRVEENALFLSPNEEPLEKLQWGLNNYGAPVRFEVQDLHTTEFPGRAGEDVGFLRAPPEKVNDKKIKVAVLDTGIDYDHPNLKSQIVRNTEECAALEKYKDCLKKEPETSAGNCDALASVDADQNGYPLDCSGWDLTSGKNRLTGIYGSYDASDDTGHGTHIAGIIAGAANGTGVRGVSQNVEILPVKVIRTSPTAPVRPQEDLPPTTEKDLRWTGGFTDVVARGVLYAIRSHAQVMNLSLGWPKGADSHFMRQMIALAQSRGIIVVASAGNDSSDARIMPCQYPGVICVASHNPDGALSHFSSYGSFVDIAAPGLQILSTWPLKKRANNFTALGGFEIKNGTSMATPFVAGAVAGLLSAGYSPQEAYARVLAGTRPIQPSQRKYVRTGNLDLGGSFQLTPRALIFPEKKVPILLPWDRKSRELPISFSLKNIWAEGKGIRISAELLDPKGFQTIELSGHLKVGSWEVPIWAAGTVQEFSSTLMIDDVRINGKLFLQLKVEGAGLQSQVLRIPIEISVRITPDFSDSELKSFSIVGGVVSRDAILYSITPLDGEAAQDYLALDPGGGPDQEHWKTQLIRQQGLEYRVAAEAAIPPPEGQLVLLQRINLKQDGTPVYVFIYRVQGEGNRGLSSFRFEFFDRALKQLKTLSHDNKISAIPERFQWLRIQEGDQFSLGPLWMGLGTTPELDKPKFDPWNPDPEDSKRVRLYYLASDGLRSIPLAEAFSPIQLLSQGSEAAGAGKVSLIVSEGNEYKRSYLTGELKGSDFGPSLPLSLQKYRMFLGLDDVHPVTPLDFEAKLHGTAFGGVGARSNLRTTVLMSSLGAPTPLTVSDTTQKAPSETDAVIGLSGVFFGTHRKAIFARTNYLVEYQDLVSGETAFTDLNRFSFLPAFVVSRPLYPVVVGATDAQDLDRLPGVLAPGAVDAVGGVSDAMEIILPSYGAQTLLGLAHPARLRFLAGEGCELLENTVKPDVSDPSQVVFFCGDRFLRMPLYY